MKRRPVVLGLSLAALLGFAAVVLAHGAFINRRGTISAVNYERIEVGMSQEDVEILLGQPGTPIASQRDPLSLYGYRQSWEQNNIYVEIAFDRSGKVVNGGCQQRLPENWSEQAMAWLGF